MKKIFLCVIAGLSISAKGWEPIVPSECDLYAYDTSFSCCVEAAKELNDIRLLHKIHVAFYARRSQLDMDAEELLGNYFRFGNWPEYVRSSEVISFDYSNGEPDEFDIDNDRQVHRARFTLLADIHGIPFPIVIEEESEYIKREKLPEDIIASYDFSLVEGSPSKGLKDKAGRIYLTSDEDEENYLLFLRFYIRPIHIAKLSPEMVVDTIVAAFQDTLKGIMDVEENCHRFFREDML